MAEIKRIQLRGISRSPSDRMTDDGGVAESLNMHLDNTENAPSFAAEDVTTSLGLPANLKADRVFIHKTANYKNYIVIQSNKVQAYTPDVDDKEPITILSLKAGEHVNDICSIGNTLIIATNNSLYYVLYKSRAYSSLGSSIPFPQISFVRTAIAAIETPSVKVYSSSGSSTNSDATEGKWFAQGGYGSIPSEADWNAQSTGGKEHTGAIKDCLTALWERTNTLLEEAKKAGYLTSPVFITYAIELYDGEEVYRSMPILIPSTVAENLQAHVETYGEDTWEAFGPDDEGDYRWENYWYAEEKVEMVSELQKYKIYAKLQEEDFLNWKDVMSKIKIYMSAPMTWGIKEYSTQLSNRLYESREEPLSDGYTNDYTESSGNITFNTRSDYKEDVLFDSSQTFMIKEIEIFNEEKTALSEDMRKLISGQTLDLIKFIDTTREDYVVLQEQERIKDADMKHYLQAAYKLDTYNNSLILTQPTQLIDYGYNKLNAYDKISHESTGVPETTYKYEVTYVLDGATEEKVVKKSFTYKEADKYTERIYAFQIFPDSRATKMLVKCTIETKQAGGHTVVKYGQFNLLPHPYLDCAYYYGGIDKELVDLCDADSIDEYDSNTIDDLENKLIISEQSNPFVFPLKGKYTFQSKVLGIAVANTALSQGQFGQFPLYVFTEDGIWAMETAADGSFVTNKPLSRDVCINPASITSIDNAVVFVSEQGVMLLQGSRAVNISPYMNGRHYTIENTAKTIIERQDFFCDLLPVLTDKTHFLAFVKEASVAYDYAGKRLVFIKPDEKYQYVYKLDTQTWHKTAYEADLIAPINSYPRCLIQGVANGKTVVYDLSTVLDAEESKIPMRGVIATRPFDLGEPDVLKTITDVRVRGQFPKGAVKFILLGSNDGVNFSTISTLRGKSWKLFRMIILADLDPTDRISWVDVQYETRFTNKLR